MKPLKIWHFILHLRVHYQLFILSGGYLLGGLLVTDPDWHQYQLQFLNVHILLYGGATAFNSYWDKDEGPVGGLRHPPRMESWMRDFSLWMQLAGVVWAFVASDAFGIVYLTSLILFWLYSTPLARWKGRPVLSMLAIGLSTGTNSLFMGALAAGGDWSVQIITAGIGTALIVLSLYPVSQIFQLEADRKREDTTFALYVGMEGVRRFFTVAFLSGIIFISISVQHESGITAMVFFFAGFVIWALLTAWIHRLKGVEAEYAQVMRIKFLASLSFVAIISVALFIKHRISGIDW